MQALAILNLIQECPSFSPGDKMLLESRIYRAVCYVPFIAGQDNQLLQEQEHFLNCAYGISSHFSGENEIIFRDNLFAALESSGRIFEKVKGPNEALACMKEIVEKVDPLDSKAWLQVGELYRKLKMLPEALTAFIKAATIAAPHMQISCYSAGRCAEELNELVLAKELYLQSALALPGGISPLLRLIEVCAALNDQQLKQWAISNLNNLTQTPDTKKN